MLFSHGWIQCQFSGAKPISVIAPQSQIGLGVIVCAARQDILDTKAPWTIWGHFMLLPRIVNSQTRFYPDLLRSIDLG